MCSVGFEGGSRSVRVDVVRKVQGAKCKMQDDPWMHAMDGWMDGWTGDARFFIFALGRSRPFNYVGLFWLAFTFFVRRG